MSVSTLVVLLPHGLTPLVRNTDFALGTGYISKPDELFIGTYVKSRSCSVCAEVLAH